MYHLIPDEEEHTLKYSNDIRFFINGKDILLRQAYDINDKNCDYYITVYDVNKKQYNFIKHFTNKNEKLLTKII